MLKTSGNSITATRVMRSQKKSTLYSTDPSYAKSTEDKLVADKVKNHLFHPSACEACDVVSFQPFNLSAFSFPPSPLSCIPRIS